MSAGTHNGANPLFLSHSYDVQDTRARNNFTQMTAQLHPSGLQIHSWYLPLKFDLSGQYQHTQQWYIGCLTQELTPSYKMYTALQCWLPPSSLLAPYIILWLTSSCRSPSFLLMYIWQQPVDATPEQQSYMTHIIPALNPTENAALWRAVWYLSLNHHVEVVMASWWCIRGAMLVV